MSYFPEIAFISRNRYYDENIIQLIQFMQITSINKRFYIERLIVSLVHSILNDRKEKYY